MSTPELVGFEWDQSKSDRCLRERGFDFDNAAKVFSRHFRSSKPGTVHTTRSVFW